MTNKTLEMKLNVHCDKMAKFTVYEAGLADLNRADFNH